MDSNNTKAPPLHDGGFQTILNFRDVAATINSNLNRRLLRESLFFRSARPDEATPADRDRLRSHYGIHTVIDLRSKTELLRAATKRAADVTAAVPAHLQSNAALAEPVQVPGLTYREIQITGPDFERHMLSQLSWSGFFQVLFLYAFGWRMAAIAILGREVMSPRGLVGLGCDTLDASGPEISRGLSVFLDDEHNSALPLLIHCTQGKDRTGLMVALVLLICGVPVGAIEYDYELTDEKLVEERGERMAEIREMGLSDEFGRTVKGFVQAIVDHLDNKYGGLEAYLDRIQFDSEKRTKLREKLLY